MFLNEVRYKCKHGALRNLNDVTFFFNRMIRIRSLPTIADFNLILAIIVWMEHYVTTIGLIEKKE